MKRTESISRFYERFGRRLEDRPFVPHNLLRSRHSQTIVGAHRPRRFPWGWDRRDGRIVDLADGVRLNVHTVLQDKPAPAVIVFHGMTGSSDSPYMLGLSHKCWARGWHAVLPNLYNVNPEISARVFHAGASRDAAELLQALVDLHRFEEVYLVGVSMGANILLKTMGDWGPSPPDWLKAAAVISPLCDIQESNDLIEEPRNRVYQAYFTRQLKNLVRSDDLFPKPPLDARDIDNIRSIRQFDALYTVPLAGFRDVVEYYREASAVRILGEILVPTLILLAKDDPFLPTRPFRQPDVDENPNLMVHFTERGGHVGFLENDSRGDLDRAWAENRVLEYFEAFRSWGPRQGAFASSGNGSRATPSRARAG